ncbi:MAG: hypothetical protein ACRETD_14850 [Steroidobacteraceae bacterium]
MVPKDLAHDVIARPAHGKPAIQGYALQEKADLVAFQLTVRQRGKLFVDLLIHGT